MTFRFVAQHLNHFGTAVPKWGRMGGEIPGEVERGLEKVLGTVHFFKKKTSELIRWSVLHPKDICVSPKAR